MCDKQLDLFTFRANHHERLSPEAPRNPPIAAPTLDDPALIAAIPAAGLADALALAAEAGSRKLASAVPALEGLCNRFTGFGADRPVPEQIAAVQALAAIGGPGAAQAVARLLTRKVILGPGLKVAVGAAVAEVLIDRERFRAGGSVYRNWNYRPSPVAALMAVDRDASGCDRRIFGAAKVHRVSGDIANCQQEIAQIA